VIGLIKAAGVVKAAVAVTVLTTATALGAQAVLPDAASQGQAHAAAGAANASTQGIDHATAGAGNASSQGQDHAAAGPANASSGLDTTGIEDKLAANKARLLATLETVLAKLQANTNVNSHAMAAIQKHIDALNAGTSGLDRAATAVGTGGSGNAVTPTLPDPAQNHPGPGDHPSQP
jgi:hypothetical protein